MKDQQNINCDLLIIGAGFAGMVAAARAAHLGLKTVQVGNSSNLFLVSGLFDLLGVYPIDTGQIIDAPGTGFKTLRKDTPLHPYSTTDYNQVLESFDFLKKFLAAAGLEYHSNRDKNHLVLTAAGTFKPSFMVPKTFLKGCDIKQGAKRLLLVDFKGFREFSAKQIAIVLKNSCTNLKISTLTIEIPISKTIAAIPLANLFEDDQFLNYLSKEILPFSKQVDLVGLPCVCGVKESLGTMRKLEEMTGLDCFEIPGLPPSIPGLRLKNAFEKQLSQKGVTALNYSNIKFDQFRENQFIFHAPNQAPNQDRHTQITSRGVVLGSGRFHGGGLHATRKGISETIFNLPVYQPAKRDLWHNLNFFNPKGHGINLAGLETDPAFRPLNRNRKPLFKALYAVGSILAHNDFARLKSGSGVSCVSAFTAVNHFYTLSGQQ
jgi:glycerol-3-phosphate dehydrogenase subunit B